MSSESKNQVWILAHRPKGIPTDRDFDLRNIPSPEEKELKDNQIIVRSEYVSVDPYLRTLLREHALGTTLTSGTIARVVASQSDAYPVDCCVVGNFPWQRATQVSVPDQASEQGETEATDVDVDPNLASLGLGCIRKLDPSLGVPPTTALGVLGMPGMTAYFGLLHVATLRPNDVVMVSAAAGAVGSLVGQLAKLRGHTVIGSAGGPDKCNYVTKELGMDACLDHRQFRDQEGARDELLRLAPNGIDVYFDNTGGHVTDAVFDVLNKYGRVAICGQIAHYNQEEKPMVPLMLHKLIYKSIRVQGFSVRDFVSKSHEFYQYMMPLIKQGKIKYQETIIKGFEQIPTAFIGLFHGKNIGKTIVQV